MARSDRNSSRGKSALPPSAARSKSVATSEDVGAFLEQVKKTPLSPLVSGGAKGRLMFGMNATLSRQPTWDLAASIQAEMFEAGAGETGLSVRLVYFRGRRELSATPWLSDAAKLADSMAKVSCRAGRTQLGRMLRYALKESRESGVKVFVYVGDCFEEEADPILAVAGQLALHGTRCFMFHEGGDPTAGRVFREVARLTGGAYAKFDLHAADTLRTLLKAAAAYATGGYEGLARLERDGGGRSEKHIEQVRRLMNQVKR